MPFLAAAFPAIAAFASSTIGSIVISLAVSVGASLLGAMLNPTNADEQAAAPSGMRLSVQMGDTLPLSFTVGYCGTAGSKKYSMSWGQAGDVPNAYVTEVFQISDIPVPGLDGFWANKQKCTILWGDTPTSQGYPVSEFRESGVDHMWVKFRDGTETTADAFMVGTFGTHPDYPWTSDFIGRGAPHAIVTTLWNRELFKSSIPTCMFEPTPTKFYDIRLDSTNGGSGAHRWDNQATWATTTNPVVIMYNVIRGVYYDGVWIYGGRNLPAFRLPASSWIAAANECDVPRSLAGGGTEPQFRCGMEINVNVEPLTTIEELKRSCNARMSEIGGIFEILVGAPGAAVYSFTDADIIISRGQKYSSFPGLNDTHNAIEATYAEPAEMWAQKSAPPRYNAAWETRDGGRRLATGVALRAVPYAVQAQQIMQNLINDDQNWRTHWITLPPDAWVLTGTCVVSWTSERNGYVNKKFLVQRVDGEPGMCQPIVLREIDPADYSWTSDEELEHPIGHLVIVRPSPQLVTGFQVFPATIYDDDATPRRPSIQVVYDGNMPDIRSVHILVRLASSGVYMYDGEIPFAVPYSNILNGVFLPNTEYEVAAKYMPFSGRPTEFTAYLSVTTPDVQLVPGKDFDPFDGVIGFDRLDTDVLAYQEWAGRNLRDIYEQIEAQDAQTADQEFANAMQFKEIRQELAVTAGGLTATFDQTFTVLIAPINGQLVAIAEALTEVTAGDTGQINTARWRMGVQTGPTGYSRLAGEARFDPDDQADWDGRVAAFYLDVPNNPALPTRFVVSAEQFIFLVSGTLENPFIVDGGGLRVNNALVKTASIGDAQITSAKIGDAQITRAKIATAAIGSAEIDTAAITNAKIANGAIDNAKLGTAVIQTANIVAGNVSETHSVIHDTGIVCVDTTGVLTTVETITISAPVGSVVVLFECEVAMGSSTSYQMNIYKNGVQLGDDRIYSTVNGNGLRSFTYRDSAPGTVTYSIVHEGTGGGGSVTCTFRSIVAINNKV